MLLFYVSACEIKESTSDQVKNDFDSLENVNTAQQFSIPDSLVIAHRGTTYWAPEETEAAYRWARNTGADYLEIDLQRTKDGVLIALHDDDLSRTTDVEEKFPGRKNYSVSEFTYEELLTLDAGSWFNKENPDRARASFKKSDILTLEDVIMIAEGNRILRAQGKKRFYFDKKLKKNIPEYEEDYLDNGNRPGIYIETKIPSKFPGIEADLKRELTNLGWYHSDKDSLRKIPTQKGKVEVANTNRRLILQTFSKESLVKLSNEFGNNVPLCFLLWRGTDPDDIPDNSPESYSKWIEFAKNNNADIIGPSISGEPNNYPDLLNEDHYKIIKKSNLIIHAYSFDTYGQMKEFHSRCEGMFTNKSDEALKFYGKNGDPGNITLDKLGY